MDKALLMDIFVNALQNNNSNLVSTKVKFQGMCRLFLTVPCFWLAIDVCTCALVFSTFEVASDSKGELRICLPRYGTVVLEQRAPGTPHINWKYQRKKLIKLIDPSGIGTHASRPLSGLESSMLPMSYILWHWTVTLIIQLTCDLMDVQYMCTEAWSCTEVWTSVNGTSSCINAHEYSELILFKEIAIASSLLNGTQPCCTSN